MAVTTNYGSRIMTGLAASTQQLADPGEGGGKVRVWIETVETAADDTTASRYIMARIPSNARLLGASRIYNDALGTATATLSVGLTNTTGRTDFTNSTTGINSGLITSSASTVGRPLIGDVANYGKRAWEFTTATTDPKCDMFLELQLATANLSSGAGTITVELFYALD